MTEAELRLQDDEAALASGRRRDIGLAAVAQNYAGHPSPWLIGIFLCAALVARLAVGDWRTSDLILPAVMLALFPFFEWVVHTSILHWRPKRVAGLTVDPLLARKHREHHADPRDIPLIFIPWQALLWLLPVYAAIGLLAFPRVGLGLTFLVVVGALGSAYEWTHYLIHSDYRPRTRLYKAIWRNHRLHHYRNEHYWFTVTTSGTADRLLGTYPHPQGVKPSPTAKNLHAA
jgi:Fatty acid hydroxylase